MRFAYTDQVEEDVFRQLVESNARDSITGLYARLDLGAGLAPDRVVPTYIATRFGRQRP